MNRGARVFLPCIALLASLPAFADSLTSLDDSELSAVSGREGVTVGLEFYYNAQKSVLNGTDGKPLDGQPIGATTGAATDKGSCVTVSTTSPNPCGTYWQFANHAGYTLDKAAIGGSGTQTMNGEWLAFKESWLALKIPSMKLNGGFMSGALSSANVGGVAGTGYEAFLDVGRFQSVSGACLLSNGVGSSTDCSVANIKLTPSLIMEQSSTTTCYNSSTSAVVMTCGDGAGTSGSVAARTSAGYTSISLAMNIGRLNIEYDTGSNVCNGTTIGNAACGYMKDAAGSFLALKIRDNNSNFAGMAVGGRMYLYGF